MKRLLFPIISVILVVVLFTISGCSKTTTTNTTTTTTMPLVTNSTTSTPIQTSIPPTTSSTIAASTTTTTGIAVTVGISNNSGIGSYLVDAKGITLYWTTRDSVGQSNITGTTLANWPLFYSAGVTVRGSLSASDFATITRADGSTQTTYKGWPLYYYIGDKVAGDTTGQGLAGVWFAASPTVSGPTATTTSTSSRTPTLAMFGPSPLAP